VVGRRSVLLVVAGGLLTALAMLSLWSWRTFASSQGFADVATDMLKEPTVQRIVADQVINQLEDQDLTTQLTAAGRPVLEPIVEQVIGSPGFQGIFHASVRQIHSGFVDGIRSRMIVPIDDSAHLVKDALTVVNSGLAESVPEEALVNLGSAQRLPIANVIETASIAGWLALPLAVAAAGCFIIAVRHAADRRRAIEAVGLCLVIVGVAFFALLAVGVSLAAQFGSDPEQRTALRAVFWSTTHLLNVQGKVVITIGAVLVVAASYVGKGRPSGRARDVWTSTKASLTQPQGRVAVSLLGICCAVFAMAFPAATAAIAVRIGAFVAFVAGTVGLMDAIGERQWAIGSSPRVRQASTRLVTGTVAAVAGLSAILLFGGVAFARAVRAPGGDPPGIAETGCNEHPALCDRHVDEVAFAATHNSMASGRSWAMRVHFDSIEGQLARGVRGFLIDLHYGARSHNIVHTDFLGDREEEIAKLTSYQKKALGSMAATLGGVPPSERRDVYLCHGFCELGADLAVDVFRGVDDWLGRNPNNVLIFVVEDHVDTEAAITAFERSGLADRAYAWQPGEPFPTLREMIEAGKQLLIFAENRGGAEPWYIPAFEGAIEETPFKFASQDEFSCDSGRGQDGSALFLVNHFITPDGPPDPRVAGDANSSDVLGRRLRACRTQRGRMPNLVAVDFSTRGDLLQEVDRLNLPRSRSLAA
jgi:hypothetical protein